MKKNIKKIGEVVRVDGHSYRIETAEQEGMPEEIRLVPFSTGSVASSLTSYNSYEYTHGGGVYRHAVARAKELRDAIFVHQEEVSL